MNIQQLKLLIKNLPDDMPVLLSDSAISFCDPEISISDIEERKGCLFYEFDPNIDYEEELDGYKKIKALTIY